MICAGIIDGIIVDLWRVSGEVKITAETYIAFCRSIYRALFQAAENYIQEDDDVHSR